MATQSNIDGDLFVRGTFRANAASLPAGCLGDTQFSGSDPLTAAKQEHQITKTLAQVHGSVATTERRPIHVARGAGVVAGFRAGSVVANVGAATVTADLRKNGTSILSAVITLDNANTAFIPEAGTVNTDDYVADDVFEVVLTATAGGGTLGQGVFAEAVFREAAD